MHSELRNIQEFVNSSSGLIKILERLKECGDIEESIKELGDIESIRELNQEKFILHNALREWAKKWLKEVK